MMQPYCIFSFHYDCVFEYVSTLICRMEILNISLHWFVGWRSWTFLYTDMSDGNLEKTLHLDVGWRSWTHLYTGISDGGLEKNFTLYVGWRFWTRLYLELSFRKHAFTLCRLENYPEHAFTLVCRLKNYPEHTFTLICRWRAILKWSLHWYIGWRNIWTGFYTDT